MTATMLVRIAICPETNSYGLLLTWSRADCSQWFPFDRRITREIPQYENLSILRLSQPKAYNNLSVSAHVLAWRTGGP